MCAPTQTRREQRPSSERLAINMAEYMLRYHYGSGNIVSSTVKFVDKDRSLPFLDGESKNQVRRLMIFTCRFHGMATREVQAWCVICSMNKGCRLFWHPVRISFNILGHSSNDFNQSHTIQGDFPVEKEIADLIPAHRALAVRVN